MIVGVWVNPRDGGATQVLDELDNVIGIIGVDIVDERNDVEIDDDVRDVERDNDDWDVERDDDEVDNDDWNVECENEDWEVEGRIDLENNEWVY